MPVSIFEQYYQMVQHLDNSVKIQLIEQLQKDVSQKPLNDLSKLTAHLDFVNGDSDDLINISWEKELNLDFPK